MDEEIRRKRDKEIWKLLRRLVDEIGEDDMVKIWDRMKDWINDRRVEMKMSDEKKRRNNVKKRDEIIKKKIGELGEEDKVRERIKNVMGKGVKEGRGVRVNSENNEK